MLLYGFRSCIIIVRKIKPIAILSPSFSTSITLLSCSNFQTILKTEFIKRDFHKNANNYNVIKLKSREEQDVIDNERLQKLLEDDSNNKKYKLLKYELEYLQQLNEQVPQNIRPKDWILLIKAPTKSQQRKFLKFLFVNEMKEQNYKKKKIAIKEALLKQWEEKQETFTSGLTYGLTNNSLFLRFYDKTMDHFFNYNMIMSMLFEPKIVFDCGFEDNMTMLELNNCAKQLLFSFALNRMHMSPAHLYLCNASRNGKLMQQLNLRIPSLYEDTFPLECTPKSYLDIFDKDKLVYLTPHCRTVMTSYNPDKIYIIGAIVDKSDPKPYTLAKAKKEGITMEQLPLDKYLHWNAGSGKSLTLNQVLSVLLDLKCKKDWLAALGKHIPVRKLVNDKDRSVVKNKWQVNNKNKLAE